VRPSQIEQPPISNKKQNQDAPHQVVNVHPAHDHPLQVALVICDSMNQQPHTGEGNQKRNRRNEHALPRPVGYRGADQVAQSRQLQQHEQHRDDQADECEQESSASFRHTLS